MPAEDQLTVAGNVSLTVKLLTNANFVNFFKKVFFGKAFKFITWTRSIVQLLLHSDFSGKITKQGQNCNFNGLFGLNIF